MCCEIQERNRDEIKKKRLHYCTHCCTNTCCRVTVYFLTIRNVQHQPSLRITVVNGVAERHGLPGAIQPISMICQGMQCKMCGGVKAQCLTCRENVFSKDTEYISCSRFAEVCFLQIGDDLQSWRSHHHTRFVERLHLSHMTESLLTDILFGSKYCCELDHIPVVGNAGGGHEGTRCECVPRAACNTAQYVSLTGSPAESSKFIRLQGPKV